MMKEKRQIFKNLWLLFPGLLFLCNPEVALIDPLPDFFGYLFLMFALLPFSDVNDYMEEAAKTFKSLIWLGLAEIFAEILVYGYLSGKQKEMNPYEQPVWILLFTFLLFVLRCYFLIPTFKKVFLGFERIFSELGVPGILTEKKGKTICERMSALSGRVVFFVSFFAMLPELSALSGGGALTLDWYSFVDMFRILCSIPSVIIFLFYLYRMVQLSKYLAKDSTLGEKLQADYEMRKQRQGRKMVKRKTELAFQFLTVSILFFMPLSISYHEILPDAVISVLVILGYFFFKDFQKKKKVLFIFAGVLFLVSVAKIILLERYLIKYVPLDSIHYPNAYDAYLPIKILGMAEGALSLLLLLTLLFLLRKMMIEHTKVVYNNPELTQKATLELHREFDMQMIPLWIFAVLIGVGKVANAFLTPKFLWVWWIPFLFVLIFFGLFSDFLTNLSEEMQASVTQSQQS